MKTAIINCFDTYEHRVRLLQAYFQKQAHEVCVITSDYRHFQKRYRHKVPDGFIFVHADAYQRNLSAARLRSHDKFAKDVFAAMETKQPDLVWVLAPPNSLVKQAAGYKKSHPKVKLVIDMIDMWPETMPVPEILNFRSRDLQGKHGVKYLPPFSWWRGLRDRYIDAADAVVTECELYQSVLKSKCDAGKLHTLYLAKADADMIPVLADTDSAGDSVAGASGQEVPEMVSGQDDTEQASEVMLPPRDRWALCYLGSINHIIDIPVICSIITNLPKQEKCPLLHVIGDGEQRDELLDAARSAGAEVIYHGKVFDPVQKQRILDGCHFGLNIMKDSVFVGLTMKSLDYFAAGLPVLNNIKGDTWMLVEKNRIGVNLDISQGGGIAFQNPGDHEVAGAVRNAHEVWYNAAYRDNVRTIFSKYFTEKAFEDKVSEILKSIMC